MNLFRRLQGLLPQQPLQVGDVIAVTEGVAIVELPGGGTINARGIAALGTRVFVQGGVIQGAAPTLPVELIEV